MAFQYILAILIIGISGLIAQVMLLRELALNFSGNELVIGVILANWLISEAAGVFYAGKFIGRIRNKINAFFILQIVFSFALFAAIYLSRMARPLLGSSYGQMLSPVAILYFSFSIIFPIGFCHGALFNFCCKIFSFNSDAYSSAGKVYAWESLGALLGGIALPYAFLPYLNSFQIAYIILLINFISCLIFIKRISRPLSYILLLLTALLFILPFGDSLSKAHYSSLKKQYQSQKLLDYRNSIYGNIAVIEREGQLTFFYNGIPSITAPKPDIFFVEEFGNLPLLFQGKPRSVLFIEGGIGGLVGEALKYPLERADYIELDPLIIDTVSRYRMPLIEKELSDKRLEVINTDARRFINSTSYKYDVVTIGFSPPSHLSANRFFTREFFSSVRRILNSDGILAFYLPGSLAYISPQMRDLNASILNSLKDNFRYVRVLPGDYNIYLASSCADVSLVVPSEVSRKIKQYNIKTSLLLPSYLEYRLDKKWESWFLSCLKGAIKRKNTDFTPFAVFQMLLIWNSQVSPYFDRILNPLKYLELGHTAIFIFLMVLFLFFYKQASRKRIGLLYCVGTTGFSGLFINLILIFSFQIACGYLYRQISVLIAVFMAGIASAGIIMTHMVPKIRRIIQGSLLFIALESLIAVFSCYLGWSIVSQGTRVYSPLFFIFSSFLAGLLVGGEFPLALSLYKNSKGDTTEAVGVVYGVDLIGGVIAGILGGVVLLPVLGLFKSCLLVAMLKISSILLYGVREYMQGRGQENL
ncbi:MAG: fused MFS/spermidine synthase [Candidatus Omnitrophota bacterium]